MADVFISHAGSTKQLTRRIAEALRATGFTVWWDEDISLHGPFRREIDDHLHAARAVVIVWSADALESDWVDAEADFAREARTLVQVTADGTVPPLPFNRIQYADLRSWDGDIEAPAWRKVVASVRTLVGRSLAANVDPQPPGASSSRTRGWGPRTIAAALLIAAGAAIIGWRVTIETAPAAAPAGEAPASARSAGVTGAPEFANRPAIVVLPFSTASDEPEQTAFADGLTEDLITRLSSWRAFPVIGRVSSFHYRGATDITRVAQELKVRYLVQGSVRRAADRLRVSAQLVDGTSGETVWSRAYDRDVADVFALQDEISSAIVAPLVGDLSRAEAHRARQRGPQDLDAWNLFQLGQQHLDHFTVQDIEDAQPLLERAVMLEPEFATAHAELSYVYSWQYALALGHDVQQSLDRARKMARRAIELDPLDARGHCALAYALLLSHETANGLAAAQTAIELNPSSPEAWSNFAYAKLASGDFQASIRANERGLELDPHRLIPGVRENLAEAYFELGDLETALKHARMAVAAQPEYLWGYVDLAMISAELGHDADARNALANARRLQPTLTRAWVNESSGLPLPAMQAHWDTALTKAGLD